MFNNSRKFIAVVLLSFVVAGCSNYQVVTPRKAIKAPEAQTTKVVSNQGTKEMSRRQIEREGAQAARERRMGAVEKDEFGDINFSQSVAPQTARASTSGDIKWTEGVAPRVAQAPRAAPTRTAPPRANVTSRAGEQFPSLVVTNEPPPSVVYRRGSRDTVLEEASVNRVRRDSDLSDQKIETAVTAKARELYRDMKEAERKFDVAHKKYETLRNRNNVQISEYYSLVGNISAALRTGTTPGNPILVDRWNAAQNKLNDLPKNINLINNLAVDLSAQASRVAFISESVQSAYSISGAVDADHVMLRSIEDKTGQMVTDLNRLIMNVNREINRIDALLKTESANMQTLSLGIANGELYGESLANTMQRRTVDEAAKTSKPEEDRRRKPLVIIRFDKANIDYERPLYRAVSAALDKYPSARFTLMTVSPESDNKAKESIDRRAARKHGEDVMDSLIKMGLPASRVTIESSVNEQAKSAEIHIFLR